MTRNQSKARFWTILAIVNLVMLLYPISMLLGGDSQDGSIMGVIALCGVGLILAVGDMISVLLAYSTSY
jgi:hypothetical protein